MESVERPASTLEPTGCSPGLLPACNKSVPLCVIYEGWVSVKAWSAPGWLWQVLVAADQVVVVWTSHLYGRVAHGVVRPGRASLARSRVPKGPLRKIGCCRPPDLGESSDARSAVGP